MITIIHYIKEQNYGKCVVVGKCVQSFAKPGQNGPWFWEKSLSKYV